MRGRRPKLDRPVAWKLKIPESVAKAISLHLLDGEGNMPVGARSELTTRLYLRYLQELEETPSPDLDDMLGDVQ